MKPTNMSPRHSPEGCVPQVNVEGTARECGRMLGYAWREQLLRRAATLPIGRSPWWRRPPCSKLVQRLAPHLPELYLGMAESAGLKPEQVGSLAHPDNGGCTSFAVAPAATLDGKPLSGQTKDTAEHRIYQYQVLRLKLTDAPPALTLTYEGWLFGHGFVRGGCAIFRNSLYAGSPRRGLRHTAWGMLALHCRDVEQVMRLTRDHGCVIAGHMTVSDEHGGIVGVEFTADGTAFVKPRRGVYVHANAVVGRRSLALGERAETGFTREDSLHREKRLRLRFLGDLGRLTPQLAYAAAMDHEGLPRSVCRHENTERATTAVVIAEPTRGLLHVTRGSPCQHWPTTYRL